MEKLPLDVTVTVQIHGDIFPSEGWPLAEIPGCCLTLQDEARQTKKQQRSKRKKSKHGKWRAQGQRWNQLTVVATESVLINRQRLSSWVKNQTRLSQAQDGPEMLKVMEAHGTALLDASGTNKVLTPSQSRGGGAVGRHHFDPDAKATRAGRGHLRRCSRQTPELVFGGRRGAFLQQTAEAGSPVSVGTKPPAPRFGWAAT